MLNIDELVAEIQRQHNQIIKLQKENTQLKLTIDLARNAIGKLKNSL